MIQIDIDKPARCIDCPLCVNYDCIIHKRITGEYYDGLNEQYEHCPLICIEVDGEFLSDLPSDQPERKTDEWCVDCKEYDHENKSCPRFNHVIRTALSDRQKGIWIYRSDMNWVDMWQCSECGEKTTSTIMGKPRFKYCPMCGSEMEVTE